MDQQELARAVFHKMYDNDPFSQWLGVELVEIGPGTATLQMTVRREMTNGFALCHGGVTFSLADSALAFASNTQGRVAVSIDAHITWPVGVSEGDVLTAVAEPLSTGNRISSYNVTVSKHDGTRVAHFRGTVYQTSKPHLED